MAIQDYDEVYALWRAAEGIGLSDADSQEGVGRFLERNPGLSFVALERDGINKCHIFVFRDNQDAIAFWKNSGWTQRVELVMMSQHIAKDG